MEVNFRLILIIISVVAICGIYLNGRYKIRKNKNPYKLKAQAKTQFEPEPEAEQYRAYDSDGFDSDGVGRVKPIVDDFQFVDTAPVDLATPPVMSEQDSVEQMPTIADIEQFEQNFEPVVDDLDYQGSEPEASETINESLEQASDDLVSKPLNSAADNTDSVLIDDMPSMSALEPSERVNKPVNEAVASPAKTVSKTVKAGKPAKAEPSTTKKTKTRAELKRDQLEIDFDASQEGKKLEPEQEVLALSVVVNDGQLISGAALLPSLLTLGMKFGEMNIFHRHEDNAGNGQITFSLANMVNPGTFDVDNMEHFTTKGLTLFMTLPNAGDPAKVFKYMLSAARQLADEFGGQVLDSKRSMMTKQTEQHYMSKIREFDRKSRLAGY